MVVIYCSPPLRRHNSLPTRVTAGTSEVLNQLGFPSVQHSVPETVYQPTTASTSGSTYRSTAAPVPDLRSHGDSSLPFATVSSRSDHMVAGPHPSHVIFCAVVYVYCSFSNADLSSRL